MPAVLAEVLAGIGQAVESGVEGHRGDGDGDGDGGVVGWGEVGERFCVGGGALFVRGGGGGESWGVRCGWVWVCAVWVSSVRWWALVISW
jgi:hypothetical protein